MRRQAYSLAERYGKLYRWAGMALVFIWLSFDAAVVQSVISTVGAAAQISAQLQAPTKSPDRLPERESTPSERK